MDAAGVEAAVGAEAGAEVLAGEEDFIQDMVTQDMVIRVMPLEIRLMVSHITEILILEIPMFLR